MKKWISGILFVIIILGFQIVKQTQRYDAKQERKEKYLSGYYDNMSVKSSLLATELEVNPISKYIPPKGWSNYIISNSFSISVPMTVELRKIDDVYTQLVKDKEWNEDEFKQCRLSTKRIGN